MICPSCNTPNRDDAKFCKKCRYDFHASAVKAKVPEAVMVNQLSAPAQGGVNEVEDISQAPTQIISPQQMMAFHANLWQKDGEQDHQGTPSAVVGAEPEGHNAELPAQVPSPDPTPMPMPQLQDEAAPVVTKQSEGQSEQGPLSEADDVVPIPPPPPVTADGEVVIAPPPSIEENNPYLMETVYPPLAETVYASPEPAETTGATGTAANVEKGEGSQKQREDMLDKTVPANDDNTHNAVPDEVEGATILPTTPANATPANGDFPTLVVGTTVIGRYEVMQVVSDEASAHLYDVIDHQGYQRCWNCASEQNGEGDEFCNDCGAELLNAPYIMHEYAATANGQDASVLHGNIVNTFVDAGRTYVIVQLQAIEDAFPTGVHLLAASDSDAGNVRRSEPNEDSTLLLTLQRVHESQSIPSGVFIVADGMGGHDNGQGASRLAISTIAERMVRELLSDPLIAEQKGEAVKPFDEDALVTLLQGSVEDANAAICKVNQRDKTDMGSTITGFMVYKDYAYILNVGDSRTYMIRGGQIYQLTTDHSLVGQLVAGGLIQPDDVYTHPQRSQIFRSLGDKLNVQIDIFKQQLHLGDILLSCSDGLWEMVRNPELEGILTKAPDPQAACAQLIEAANANGGEDNISSIVVFVH